MKKYALLLILVIVCLNGGVGIAASELKVGATPVPHAEILEFLKPILNERGIELEVVVFNDYVQPNLALAEGELDANFFQHVPYLETFSKDHRLELDFIAGVHIEPLGFYSKKIKKISDLKKNAVVAIPNDPSNEGRALKLLEVNGLIKLDPEAGLKATLLDIVENPLKITFRELEAAQLPRILQDVDGAIINTNYALPAGLIPIKDALIIEDKQSPYVNVLAVQKDNKKDKNLRILAEVLTSEEVKIFILENYHGSIVPTPFLNLD